MTREAVLTEDETSGRRTLIRVPDEAMVGRNAKHSSANDNRIIGSELTRVPFRQRHQDSDQGDPSDRL